eukprot:28515_1
MTQPQRMFSCDSCKIKFIRSQLSFRHGQAIMTMLRQKGDLGRQIIPLISIKAWRHICNACNQSEIRAHQMHVAESGGAIINLDKTTEWRKFCNEYHDIAAKHGFGIGKCPLKQYSPFENNNASNSWYKGGKFKTYNTLEFFTQCLDDKKDVGNSDDEKGDEVVIYDTSGATSTGDEFGCLVNYMHIKKFAQVHSKSTWFKEQKLPTYMKNKGFLCRSPLSYDRLLGRVKKAGKKHFLFKNNDNLWNDYEQMMKQVKKLSDKKYHAGTTKAISIQAVKDGMFAKDKRLQKGFAKSKKGKSGSDIISNNLTEHKEKHDKKLSFEEQKLLNMQKHTEILGDIGK